jgi:hypothetical protein
MAKTATSNTPHFDKLGIEIFPGDYIVTSSGNRKILIAQVIKLNPKMLTIRKIGTKYNVYTYSTETVKLDSQLITMYILRNNK